MPLTERSRAAEVEGTQPASSPGLSTTPVGTEGAHEAQLGVPTRGGFPCRPAPESIRVRTTFGSSLLPLTQKLLHKRHTFAPTLSKARTLHPNTLAHALSILNMPVHSDSYCTH